MNYYKGLVKQSISRSREATLGVLGISDQGLRKHLNNTISDILGDEGCFLAPPVFEHTFGWEESNETFASLSGNLLSSSLVETLNSTDKYPFPSHIHPYKHQITAWNALLDKTPKSTIITTGTGSGKTECFMVPILNDLISEYEDTKRPLVGIRALFLYPLNALINSQQERLHAWTKRYGDGVRFCLYNGKTEERASRVRKEQQLKPNQVMSRENLRKDPSPILMTNATMLEYMLVRQVDSPIIQASREAGSLRWIVLDEAHTYIGSQAAELSLLLRRVVHAFGKKAADIRFVATSATIADEDATERLREYLAGLAGVATEQVVVIGGKRIVPDINPKQSIQNRALEDILSIDAGSEVSEDRYDALASSGVPAKLRQLIVNNARPQRFDDLMATVQNHLQGSTALDQQDELLGWLDLMTGTKPNSESPAFLKGRMHLFQRMLHGLWSCVNPQCAVKGSELGGWPFGNVYVTERSRCSCLSPVLELGFCGDCQTPHLIAEDKKGILQQRTPYISDEFSLNHDFDDEGDEDDAPIEENIYSHSQTRIVLSPQNLPSVNYVSQTLDLKTHELGSLDSSDSIAIQLCEEENSVCGCCEFEGNHGRSFLHMCYLGAPFYVANAVPTVLEYCPDPDIKDCEGRSPEELPGRGRKLITFTDSRQGTARMAVRMQQEAERSRLRGLVFQTLRNAQAKLESNGSSVPDASYDELINNAISLEKIGYKSEAQKIRQDAEAMKAGVTIGRAAEIHWNDLATELSVTTDISQSILAYNKYANPPLFSEIESGTIMARLLLAREYSRRPKNQNSTETLGLVKVGYFGLDNISEAPNYWSETKCAKAIGNETAPLSLQDWRDYLKVLLDFYVRENTFIPLQDDMRNWMGGRFLPKQLYAPSSEIQESSTVRIWPQVRPGAPNRAVKLLEAATGVDRTSAVGKDKINYWLTSAWEALIKAHILESISGGYALKLNSLTFSLPSNAWECPFTRRLFDTTFRGLTPYLPRKLMDRDYRCNPVILPEYSSLTPSSNPESAMVQIRKLVAADANIQTLRNANLWTDISDRTVEGGFYYRTAEHSAQQSSQKLDMYEELFKKGKVNVLNCSTTMEMGVDIGGISAVVMNNVPPHPANYLQRAGRAGRRSESRAIAYTLCKADPHNQRVFKQPDWPFITPITAPNITLSSDRIVHRHVNSFLLSCFLNQEMISDDNTKLTLRWFFHGEDSPCEQFVSWLSCLPNPVETGIASIVHGTGISGYAISNLTDTSISSISDIQQGWQNEYSKLTTKVTSAAEDAYKRAVERELSRHEEEYLLKELSVKAFLPGYGFPTNVVNLNTYNVEDFKNKPKRKSENSREDNIFNNKEQPARGLDIAIREYAPGAQLVVDGRVYRSAGVSLHWHSGGAINESQKFDIAWYCTNCGATGVTENAYSNSDNISCYHCETPVTEKKQVLRPAGFLTDFYEPTSNDVSTQKFIGIERARIHLDGELVSLPDKKCGFVRYGHSGSVFYHSSGEHGKGYAVCMSCGRSESMLGNGDLPSLLAPDKSHRPIGGLSGVTKEKNCSGEAVMRDIYLGFSTKTDVLEWALRSPVTGHWLTDRREDQAIAMTLAVALRDCIARSIGIESTEMGFSIRLDKDLDSRQNRSIVQVYDQVSGGAGFVLSGVSSDLTQLLYDVVASLNCPVECENVCSFCLAGKDSRVELEELDRKAALGWMQDNHYLDFLVLPTSFSSIDGARYLSLEPLRFIQSLVNKGIETLDIPLGSDYDKWDLGHPHFRDKILNWLVVDKLQIFIGIPSDVLNQYSILSELALLAKLGANFYSYTSGRGTDITSTISAFGKNECLTLHSNNSLSIIPGDYWMKSGSEIIWIYSSEAVPDNYTLLDTKNWGADDSAQIVEVTTELNGELSSLGERFEALLRDVSPKTIELINTDKAVSVQYTDRYLKSPWSVMVLAQFLSVFKGDRLESVSVDTLASSTERSSFEIKHDWPTSNEQFEITEYWINGITEAKPNIKLHDRPYEIQHGREILVKWASGVTSRLFFDQGVGYWNPRTMNRELSKFDFNTDYENQRQQMINKYKGLKLINSGVWPTFITILNE